MIPVTIAGPTGTVTSKRPTITGTGEPNAAVEVYREGGGLLGTVTVGSDGKWSLPLTSDLANGNYTIRADQNANGVKTSASGSFEVKVAEGLAYTSPKNGAVLDSRSVTLTGTGGVPGKYVYFAEGGYSIGAALADASGNWSFGPRDYKYGAHTVYVKDSLSDPNSRVAQVSFSIAALAPVVIQGPTGEVAQTRPVITGTAEPGATITVKDDKGNVIGTANVASNGKWSVTPTKDLANGTYAITAEQSLDGKTSSAMGSFEVFVAKKVAVTGPTGTTNDPRPAITGTGQPGAAITVKDGKGNTLGTTTVGADGKWTLTPTKDLANGTYAITAEQDAKGQTSTATGSFDVNVAKKIAVTGPTGTTNDPRPAITGTGQPGATVTVTDGNGAVLGTATVGSDGKWSVKPGKDLPEGSVSITAEQNAGGQTSSATGSFDVNLIDDLTVTGPTPGSTVDSKKPVVSGTAEPGAEITVKDKDGTVIGETVAGEDGKWSTGIGTLPTGPVEIVVTDNHGGSQNVDFTVPADELVVTGPKPGENVDSKTPTVSGTGEPGAEITMTDKDGNVIGETVVDENGNWSVTLPELGGGSTGVTVTDNHGGSKDIDFEVPFEKLVVTGPTAGSTVDSKQPVVSGTAEPGAEITVKDKGGNVIGETVAGSDGKWTTPVSTLPTGKNEITVTDNHGGSQNVDFTVPAGELVVIAPAPEGGATPTVDEKAPTVSGTGEPGAEITITDQDGNVIGETVVDENGDWAVTLPELENGDHTITVTDNHGGSKEVEFIVSAENGDEPMTAGSLAGVMLAGAAGLGLLIRRRQQAKTDA